MTTEAPTLHPEDEPGVDPDPAPDTHVDRGALRELLTIAGPTVATMTSYTVMTFVDKLMVSRIGPDPIYVGSQGNGGLAAWIPISICMGTLTIINTYVSQNLGAKTPERAPAYAWNGLWLAAIFWAVALLPFAWFLPRVFEALGHDPERVRLASDYGRILLVGAVLTMSTRALSQFFFGMHRPSIVLMAGVTANIVNVALVYAFVFGAWGFPRLGVAGSAVGTVIATGVELLIPATVFLGKAMNEKYRTRSQWRLSRSHVRDILRLGWPGGCMFGNEMICWGYFMVALVGGFGKEHSTAGWIAHQYMSLSFMPAVGISVAVTASVGKCMGMGRADLAAKRAWVGVGITLAYMGLCAIAFVVFREQLIRFFIEKNTAPETVEILVRIGSAALIAAAAFQIFDAVAITLTGALRGAGDTVYPGIVTLVLSWVIIVGGGKAMVTFVPQLESIGPWIAAATYIALMCLVLLHRFVGGKWKRMKVVRS